MSPGAHAFERPTPSNETEYRRKVRMFEHCWEITLRGSMFRRLPPLYLAEVVSHRLLRYGSGILHLTLLATSVALAGDGWALWDRACRPGGADRARRQPAYRSRGTTSSSRGRPSSALWELPAARRARAIGASRHLRARRSWPTASGEGSRCRSAAAGARRPRPDRAGRQAAEHRATQGDLPAMLEHPHLAPVLRLVRRRRPLERVSPGLIDGPPAGLHHAVRQREVVPPARIDLDVVASRLSA